MNLADPQRRFAITFACAFAAALTFAVLMRSGAALDAAGGHVARGSNASLGRTAAPPPQVFLRPLAATTVTDRYPWLLGIIPAPQPFLHDTQIVSYYGSPYTADMGILGVADIETVATQLEAHTARYDALNGPVDAVAAIHLVYAVAQPEPTGNGLYLQYAADEDVRRLIRLTQARGMLFFIDLQIGRSTVEAEIEKVLPYLRYSHVHLAIDPEFAVTAGQVPGVTLGSLHAADIDRAQAALQRLVRTEELPRKLLIVHQFADSMVPDGEAIRRYPDVELIIDVDGFGLAAVKRATYQRYAARAYASRAAIKLFFQHDPDLMSEADVLLLEPRPAIVIYQ